MKINRNIYGLALLLLAQFGIIEIAAQRVVPLLPDGASINEFEHGPDLIIYDLEVVDGVVWIASRLAAFDGQNACLWQWDGSEYSAVQGPIYDNATFGDSVYEIIRHQDDVYLCGRFGEISDVYKYSNGEWIDLGAHSDGRVHDIVFYNGMLHLGGEFDSFNGVAGNYVYRLNGDAWESVGSPVDDAIYCMEKFDDKLYVGGYFETMGNATNNIAFLDDNEWSGISNGLSGKVSDMAIHEGNLIITGVFDTTADMSQDLFRIASVSPDGFEALIDDPELVPDSPTLSLANGDLFLSSSDNEAQASFVFSGGEVRAFEPLSILAAVIYQGELLLAGDASLKHLIEYVTPLYKHDPLRTTTVHLRNNAIDAMLHYAASWFCTPNARAAYGTLDYEGDYLPNYPSSIYSSALWYGGVENEEIYIGASLYNLGPEQAQGTYVSYGPISDNYDHDYLYRYYAVWMVTQEDIDYHLAHFQDTGYEPIGRIASYPGNGRVEFGESSHLLPFVDVDEDGWYEPMDGDYPLIRGDQSAFMIHSDLRFGNIDQKPGIELITEFYSYNTEDPSLRSTTFVHVELRNRSERNYADFSIGVWNDFDIGNSTDDRVGSQPDGNYIYAYNGDGNDEPVTSSIGYGEVIPAQGLAFLGEDMHAAVSFNNSSNPINGSPELPNHYYQFLNATWKNGQPIYYGGDGANVGTGADPENPTNFMLPSFPCDSGEEDWSEITAGIPSGDKRIVGSVSPFDFNSGEKACLDFAYVTAFPETEEMCSEITALDQRVANVNAWFDAQNFNCEWEQNPLGIEEDVETQSLLIYPNPASNQLVVASAETENIPITLFDISGRVVLEDQLQNGILKLDVSGLGSGVYLLRVHGLDVTRRLVIQK